MSELVQLRGPSSFSPVEPDAAFSMSEAAERRIAEVKASYPSQKSAVMTALYLAQQEHAWLKPQCIAWVAQRLELPYSHVLEVASFYTMYYKVPVGRYHVQLCRTLSCMLCGAKELTTYLKGRLKVGTGEVSEDGLWSFEEVECLGSCGTAPLVQINDVFFEKLTAESLAALMDRIERELPDLRYSDKDRKLGGGLPDMPRSKVW